MLLTSVLLLSMLQLVFSQPSKIPAPTNLSGKYIEPGASSGNVGNVLLGWEWKPDTPDQRFGPFIIRRSLSNVPPFPIIGASQKLEFVDGTLPYGDTTYYYYVQKYGPDSTVSDPSQIISVHVSPFERLIITSIPPTAGVRGKLYQYKVTTISTIPGDLITYKLVSNSLGTIPPGMAIDRNSGVIQWVPAAEGFYGITIEATNQSGQKIQQSFMICITTSFNVGSLSGFITDNNNKPVENVTVSAYYIPIDQNQSIDCSGKRYIPPFSVTNNNGFYKLDSLRAGTYILVALPSTNDYFPSWWEKGNTPQEADKFILMNGQNNSADFILKATQPSNVVKICGNISDVNGKPIYNTSIRAIVIDVNTNLPVRTSSINNLIATSDVDGSYCLKVPANIPFILFGQARKYYSEFYNDKPNVLTADRMSFSSDQININFTLKDRFISKRKISGTISNRKNGVGSWIVLYNQNKSAIETFPTLSDGSFTSEDIAEQNIIVQAIPYDVRNYSSTYYTGSPLTNFNWNQSQNLPINNSIVNADIFIDAVSSEGLGTAEGKIFDLAQRPVVGALVKAVSDDNTIIGIALTNNEGNFTLLGLPEGPFTILVDKMLYEQLSSNSAYIHYNSMLQVKGIFIRMAPSAVSSVQSHSVFPKEISLEQNYPNPVYGNTSTIISFTLTDQQFVQLKITDAIGRDIAVLANNMIPAGEHSIIWNANNIQPGLYFYTLLAGEKRITKKLVII